MYCLDDEGRLTTPEGTWDSEEIKDIDMSRWIAPKGNARATWTARVITNDEQKLLLDDYVYEDMHLIIGALAHRFYPDQWSPLAKRIQVENTGDEADSSEDN